MILIIKKIVLILFSKVLMGSDICKSTPIQGHQQTQLSNITNFVTEQSPYEINLIKNQYNDSKYTGLYDVYLKEPQRTLLYKGQLKNSKFHGYGQFYPQGKLFYEGEFKNGFFEGWGITEIYTGQFRQGHYDGYGIFRVFSDDKKQYVTFYYQGYFSMGKFSGNGIQIKNGRMPTHLINKALQTEGGMIGKIDNAIEHGILFDKKIQEEQFYMGQFARGYRTGVGRLFKDNKQFSGTFMAGITKVNGTTVDYEMEKKRKNKEKCIVC